MPSKLPENWHQDIQNIQIKENKSDLRSSGVSMENGNLIDAEEYLSSDSEDISPVNNVSILESSDSEIEVIKELKTNLEHRGCNLCCEGNFLVNRLLQFGGVLTQDLKYACEVCDIGFKTNSLLTKHKKTHFTTNSLPKPANNVDILASNSPINLNSVLRSQSSPQNSPSTSLCLNKEDSTLNCSKNISIPDMLQSSFENSPSASSSPYTCDICSATYAYRKGLQQHMNKKHGNGSYVCIVCKAIFPDRKDAKKHYFTHRPANVVATCPKCGEQLPPKQSYRKHSCIP